MLEHVGPILISILLRGKCLCKTTDATQSNQIAAAVEKAKQTEHEPLDLFFALILWMHIFKYIRQKHKERRSMRFLF